MIVPWRLALAAAFNVTVGMAAASAQTVIVRSAPPGSPVELVLNASAAGSATSDAQGGATVRVDPSAAAGTTETAVRIFVEECGTTRRVLLVERDRQAPPQDAGCARREIAGLFVLRRITTLMVDVASAGPTVWIRQGPVPKEWLSIEPARARPARSWEPSLRGLVVFGGGGLGAFRDAIDSTCGNLTECNSDGSPITYVGGATFWLSPYFGIEGAYLKYGDVKADGTGERFQFTSALDTRVLTMSGKVGVPIGRTRLYGLVGANYHRSTFGTTQTIDDTEVTIDDVVEPVPGDTQSFRLKTAGWGWTFGGGIEVWLKPRFAFYGEFGRSALKGKGVDGDAGAFDERVTSLIVGARVRIGR